MRQKIIFLSISLIAIFFLSFLIPKEDSSFKPTKNAVLNGVTIRLVIADTEATRARGLSYLKNIPDGTGMFFIFDKPGYLSFWMKDMNFPIDIIWFDEDYHAVSLEENISSGTYPQVFTPQVLAKYVLEVPAHFITKNKIKIGDKISF